MRITIERLKRVIKDKRFHVALVCLVSVVSILLRFYLSMDAQVTYWSDFPRDYLIANHIVTYGEFPMTGPDGYFGSMLVSPAYFYFLSLPLLIFNDIKFLSLFNVFLQILSLLGVYALARTLFGKGTALIALTLFGLSSAIIWQSFVIWQPHVMQPFIILSYLLLALGYKKGSIPLLIWSTAIFLVSITLHYSVLAMAPAYLVILILAFRKAGAKMKDYMLAGIIASIVWILLYTPVILFQSGVDYDAGGQGVLDAFKYQILGKAESSIVAITINFFDRLSTLLNFFLNENATFVHSTNNTYVTYIAMVLLLTATIFYLSKIKESHKRCLILMIVLAISSSLLMAAIPTFSPNESFGPRYLTSAMSLLVILVSEMIYRVGTRNALTSMVRVGLVLGVVYLTLINHSTTWGRIRTIFSAETVTKASTFFVPEQGIDQYNLAHQSVASEIRTLSKKQRDLNFFSIVSLFPNDSTIDAFALGVDEPLWVQLENEFDTKLIMVDNYELRDHSPIAKSPEYIFLRCWHDASTLSLVNVSHCMDIFLTEKPLYLLEKQIYSSDEQSVFLMRKETVETRISEVSSP